ncbi:MAG: alpha-glucuronidase, partial [Bacteroidales bacterium]|nr:alpha-glucuronidase [Bacteroidales bacterium]
MKVNRFFVFSVLAALVACASPEPVDQDGSILWFANSRPYGEVLTSVETRVDGSLAPEGYHVFDEAGRRIVAGGSEAGVRYGVYALQRAEALGQAGPGIDLASEPYYEYRILNHWDNLDDSVERGYAGPSMWEWTSPQIPEERIRLYGDLCASVGINGSVLNNVNS